MGRARVEVVPRTITRVAAYLRVSTDEQAVSGLGLGDQRRRCDGMAASKAWPDPEVYADEGVSGTKEPNERPALAHLLAEVRAGRIDAVIVLDLSRLARKTMYVLSLVEEFRRYDVALISCKEALDTSTPQGHFVLTMFAALAQLERDLISERTRAALAEHGRRDGERGGRVPYGYRRTPAGIVVESDAAAHVRLIYSLRRRGKSLREIAEHLKTHDGAGPRGSIWRHSGIAEILKNQDAYKGGLRGESQVRWPRILAR